MDSTFSKKALLDHCDRFLQHEDEAEFVALVRRHADLFEQIAIEEEKRTSLDDERTVFVYPH